LENLRWIAAAALSAYACQLAVHHTTPIDSALPFLAVAVTLLAWLSYSEAMLGVPMLLGAEIAIADEPMRLLAFGAILAAAVAIATLSSRASSKSPSPSVPLCLCGECERPSHDARGHSPQRHRGTEGDGGSLDARNDKGAPLVALVAILLLRWLPLSDVAIGRELVLLALSLSIVFVLGRTPFAVAVAVITALLTTAIPLRTLAIPLAVLLVAAAARTFGMPKVRLAWPSTMVLAFAMLFFAWSGIVARAFPYFLRAATPERPRTDVKQALAPNRSETYDVPEGATSLIVSGANVAHLRRGTILGRIFVSRQSGEGAPADCRLPTDDCIDVRIGDAADWGYLRHGAWHKAHNPLPRDAAGKVRDYGYGAWVDGAGRIPLPRGARMIRVTADGALPAHASLQVEGFE
jgi:hypothetical protein